MANFRMTKVGGGNESRLGWFVPNLINNCYAYGGGHGFEFNNCICQNVVGCETYQVNGVGFYMNNYCTSNIVSGCRAFMGRKQGVFWENSSEMNITSGMFCWHQDHAIEVRNCTWGIIAGNDIMDCGAGVGSTKHQIYLHTDVKAVEVSANCIFSWSDQYPSVSGIYEDEECRDNSIVGNLVTHSVKDGIISKGRNTLVANNLYQPEAYYNPGVEPFAKRNRRYKEPIGPFNSARLDWYRESWYGPVDWTEILKKPVTP